MKKAWEINREILEKEIPFPERVTRVSWDEVIRDGKRDLGNMQYLWGGNVTESLMPLFFISVYIQEYENLGYNVEEAEAMLPEGIELARKKDDVALYRHTCRLLHKLFQSPKNTQHEYWKYPVYETFDAYAEAVGLTPEMKTALPYDEKELEKRIFAGWMAQVSAGAVGTAIEGYHTRNLEKVYGEIDSYIKEPEMYNDDLTFELVFLETFRRKGYQLTAADIAEDWAARLPFAFTAEGIALKNIKNGIYPPESGYFRNPFREMIGAQMRGGICGMVAPGDPYMAARLAFFDAQVSHHNNGVLGEVFNALMVSFAFVLNDMKTICRKAIDLMPRDSKYYEVVDYAWKACEKYGNWKEAWLDCDEAYKQYHWIHAYPNACAEVVALYFCGNDYDELVHIIAMCGSDTDCNAAQVANVLASAYGIECINERWLYPLGEYMETYVRGMEIVRYRTLAAQTAEAVVKARKE